MDCIAAESVISYLGHFVAGFSGNVLFEPHVDLMSQAQDLSTLHASYGGLHQYEHGQLSLTQEVSHTHISLAVC